jgi:hypothetical protein
MLSTPSSVAVLIGAAVNGSDDVLFIADLGNSVIRAVGTSKRLYILTR